MCIMENIARLKRTLVSRFDVRHIPYSFTASRTFPYRLAYRLRMTFMAITSEAYNNLNNKTVSIRVSMN